MPRRHHLAMFKHSSSEASPRSSPESVQAVPLASPDYSSSKDCITAEALNAFEMSLMRYVQAYNGDFEQTPDIGGLRKYICGHQALFREAMADSDFVASVREAIADSYAVRFFSPHASAAYEKLETELELLRRHLKKPGAQ